MADSPGGRRHPSTSSIVAIVSLVAFVALGGVTIWQTSANTSAVQAADQRKAIETKIDALSEKIDRMDVTIATIGQRLEDHIKGAEK